MQELPKVFVDLLKTATLAEKRAMLEALTLNVASETTAESTASSDDIVSLVEHVNDLNLDKTLCDDLQKELDSLNLKQRGRAVTTQWLSPTTHSLYYGHVMNKPTPINDYPNFCKLMEVVNNHPSTSGDMDSCLITRYASSKSTLRLHRDNEPLISQTSSICTVSLGAPRELSIVLDSNKNSDSPDHVLPATDKTMNIMKPGAQSKMRHAVYSGNVVGENEKVRFSLSFRKIKPPQEEQVALSQVNEQVTKKQKIVLVAGDSFAARLDEKLLGKNKQVVKNIAVGGSKLDKVKRDIEKFVKDNPNLEVVKLFVSVGTNDIRYCDNGIAHLKSAVSSLMSSIKLILPTAKVWFQSIPPINPNGCKFTERNVIQMNNLIYNMCSRYRHYFLDIFPAFLDARGCINTRLFPHFDTKKQRSDIHPNNKGMGVLARFYIFIIHSKWFNPLGF